MNPFAFFRSRAPIAMLPVLLAGGCSGNASLSTATPAAVACAEPAPPSAFSIEVYGEAVHSQCQYAFNLGISKAAYVFVPNVAASDHYVLFVQSSGKNVRCVYVSPAGKKTLPSSGTGGNNALCNPTTKNVVGIQAPGGNVSFTWAFSDSLQAGPYTIAVFDQDAYGGTGAVLGRVQVTLTS